MPGWHGPGAAEPAIDGGVDPWRGGLCDKTQRATLVGLGLNKMRRTVEVVDTPEVRGQVRKVAHLVSVETD